TRPIAKRSEAGIAGRVPAARRAVNVTAPLAIGTPGRLQCRSGGRTMDLSYSPEEEAFRTRVRAWLRDNVPASQGPVRDLPALRAWQRKLHTAGFLGAAWPKEYGGAGLTDIEQAILNEELARARAPQVVNAMAIWWVGPAIMRYGTE